MPVFASSPELGDLTFTDVVSPSDSPIPGCGLVLAQAEDKERLTLVLSPPVYDAVAAWHAAEAAGVARPERRRLKRAAQKALDRNDANLTGVAGDIAARRGWPDEWEGTP